MHLQGCRVNPLCPRQCEHDSEQVARVVISFRLLLYCKYRQGVGTTYLPHHGCSLWGHFTVSEAHRAVIHSCYRDPVVIVNMDDPDFVWEQACASPAMGSYVVRQWGQPPAHMLVGNVYPHCSPLNTFRSHPLLACDQTDVHPGDVGVFRRSIDQINCPKVP